MGAHGVNDVTLDRYFEWADNTRAVCEAGDRANAWVDQIYRRRDELDLFDPSSETARTFTRYAEPRAKHWSQSRDTLPARALGWLAEARASLRRSVEQRDRLGLVRELAWLLNSTMPILRSSHLEELHRRIGAVFVEGRGQLDATQRDDGTSIHAVHRYESTSSFVRRQGRQLFGTVYRIMRPGEPLRHAELVETWQWAPTERVTLCVPIAIGCANRCPMCEFGTYDGGNLTPDEIERMVAMNLANNRDVPITTRDDRLTIYYMGGGDPCQYPELQTLLSLIADRRPGVQQILSTIGVGEAADLERVVEAAVATAGVGLQISLCSLDETVRQSLVGGVDVQPIDRCLDALGRFHRATGAKGHVSLVLAEGLQTDADDVVRQVVDSVDPTSVHVTLTLLRRNRLPFSKRTVDAAVHASVARRLAAAGFAVGISTNDDDPDNQVSCGRSDATTLRENRAFAKRTGLMGVIDDTASHRSPSGG